MRAFICGKRWLFLLSVLREEADWKATFPALKAASVKLLSKFLEGGLGDVRKALKSERNFGEQRRSAAPQEC